jgi:peptide/nickel transport system ATP-binding protein
VTDDHEVRCIRHAVVLGDAAAARIAATPRPEIGVEDALVAIVGVNASYGTRQVLHDVGLIVRPRECLALVGESGSGKTTLARCVAGLHVSYTGEMSFRGKPLPAGARARDADTRREIQYVFQSPYNSLNPRKTIAQIIEQPLRHFFSTGGSDSRGRVRAALDRVQLSTTCLERYPHQLSGGERQRVAIARALVGRPAIVLADEPTGNLDSATGASIMALIRELNAAGATILMITHDAGLADQLPRQIRMLDGRVVSDTRRGGGVLVAGAAAELP